MVRGIGVDILEIDRMRKSIQGLGEDFLRKIFTHNEIQYCQSKADMAQHFAARFAAKEAISKALSTGWSGDFAWKDVEVMNDAMGQPHITLYGKLRETLNDASIFVSLSHSESHVVAMVVIDGRKT